MRYIVTIGHYQYEFDHASQAVAKCAEAAAWNRTAGPSYKWWYLRSQDGPVRLAHMSDQQEWDLVRRQVRATIQRKRYRRDARGARVVPVAQEVG